MHKLAKISELLIGQPMFKLLALSQISLCVGDKIPLPCSCRRSETSSSGDYPENMLAIRFADRTRAREQRSCSHLGFSPDASVCESDNAKDQGSFFAHTATGVPAS